METFNATKTFCITNREELAAYRFVTTSDYKNGFEMRVDTLDSDGQWVNDYELTFSGLAPSPREIVELYREQRQRNSGGGQGYLGAKNYTVTF